MFHSPHEGENRGGDYPPKSNVSESGHSETSRNNRYETYEESFRQAKHTYARENDLEALWRAWQEESRKVGDNGKGDTEGVGGIAPINPRDYAEASRDALEQVLAQKIITRAGRQREFTEREAGVVLRDIVKFGYKSMVGQEVLRTRGFRSMRNLLERTDISGGKAQEEELREIVGQEIRREGLRGQVQSWLERQPRLVRDGVKNFLTVGALGAGITAILVGSPITIPALAAIAGTSLGRTVGGVLIKERKLFGPEHKKGNSTAFQAAEEIIGLISALRQRAWQAETRQDLPETSGEEEYILPPQGRADILREILRTTKEERLARVEDFRRGERWAKICEYLGGLAGGLAAGSITAVLSSNILKNQAEEQGLRIVTEDHTLRGAIKEGEGHIVKKINDVWHFVIEKEDIAKAAREVPGWEKSYHAVTPEGKTDLVINYLKQVGGHLVPKQELLHVLGTEEKSKAVETLVNNLVKEKAISQIRGVAFLSAAVTALLMGNQIGSFLYQWQLEDPLIGGSKPKIRQDGRLEGYKEDAPENERDRGIIEEVCRSYNPENAGRNHLLSVNDISKRGTASLIKYIEEVRRKEEPLDRLYLKFKLVVNPGKAEAGDLQKFQSAIAGIGLNQFEDVFYVKSRDAVENGCQRIAGSDEWREFGIIHRRI